MTHYYSQEKQNLCLCNTYSSNSITEDVDRVNCYKCKEILATIKGNKFFEKETSNIKKMEAFEFKRKYENIHWNILGEIGRLKVKMRQLKKLNESFSDIEDRIEELTKEKENIEKALDI